MRALSIQQLAYSVWNLIAVANRTVEVNTKTGFSLTAGSYSVRASSNQRAVFTVADTTSSNTSAVSSVTTTRAFLGWTGGSYNTTATDPQDYMGRVTLTNATTVTGNRNDVSGNLVLSFELQELY